MKKTNIKALSAILTFGAIWGIGLAATPEPSKSHDGAVRRNLSIFNEVVKTLEENYVDSIRPDEAFKAAMDAYVSTIDPYTEYYNSDEAESLKQMTTGEYGGIGSTILEYKGAVYISDPFKGSAAADAGLRSGDKILMIDGEDLSGLSSTEVSNRLRGVAGSDLQIRVARPYVGSDSILDFNITRRKVVMPSIDWHGVVDGSTGYIKLNSFIDKSGDEVKKALEEFSADPNVKEIVIDLRGNGGGLINSAIDILGNFLPKGTEVVRTRGKGGNIEKIYKTTHKPLMPDIPLAILIDGGSASASEITAGAIQDLDRGILVGSNSYGKGLVQGMHPISNGGLLKVTVSKYLIPSGRLIQALDYSKRNPDGTVASIPDSLTNVFHTSNGREVRDGKGLKPDFEVDWGNVNPLLINLINDLYIFNYANEYAAKHPRIDSPWEFSVTDEMYNDFKQHIDTTTLVYEKRSTGLIDALRKGAEIDGYLNDDVSTLLDSLQTALTHDVYDDLEIPLNKKEIKQFLGEEIMRRYYYTEGETIFSLRDDPGLEKAISILRDPEAYNKALGKNNK